MMSFIRVAAVFVSGFALHLSTQDVSARSRNSSFTSCADFAARKDHKASIEYSFGQHGAKTVCVAFGVDGFVVDECGSNSARAARQIRAVAWLLHWGIH
jgi:hypothetical protein